MLEKSYQKREVQREYKIGDNHVGGLSIEGGLNFLHTDIERLKGQILEPWMTGGPKLGRYLIWKEGTSNPFSYHDKPLTEKNVSVCCCIMKKGSTKSGSF